MSNGERRVGCIQHRECAQRLKELEANMEHALELIGIVRTLAYGVFVGNDPTATCQAICNVLQPKKGD